MKRQFGECVIMNIKRAAAVAVLFIGASLPALAEDQKPANSQEGYLPPLNLLMVATQLNPFQVVVRRRSGKLAAGKLRVGANSNQY
jgi:hypothetical protein